MLEGDGLRLRPLAPQDRDGLYAAAADPLVWEQHPARTRHERAVFDPYFNFLVAAGGAMAVTEAATGRIIGTSRFYQTPDPADAWSIGFTFIERAAWGGVVNFAMKRLMLDHLFADTDEVWFHIAPDNLRSQRGTAKLGALRDADRTLDLGTGPALMVCYRLPRDVWQARRGLAPAG